MQIWIALSIVMLFFFLSLFIRDLFIFYRKSWDEMSGVTEKKRIVEWQELSVCIRVCVCVCVCVFVCACRVCWWDEAIGRWLFFFVWLLLGKPVWQNLTTKLWTLPCRVTQDGRVMVESSDKAWSTGEGNGKPLQYPCVENPMNSMKRQKDMIPENKPSQVDRCTICYWGRVEK